jgi:hypothetical protein
MLTPAAILVSVVVTLAVLDLKRWIPWVSERIVSAAARNFDEPGRQIKDEEYRANVRYAGGRLEHSASTAASLRSQVLAGREVLTSTV